MAKHRVTAFPFIKKDLEIASVEVAGEARPFTVDHDNEALHIELAEAGQVEVVIAFSGKIQTT